MIKNITDPLYLSKQTCVDVPEHQVQGLIPYIRAMVATCEQVGWYSMAAPQAGLNLNFFIARSPNPRDRDYDTLFNPSYAPVDGSTLSTIEEMGPDGVRYKAKRWNSIQMSWYRHNGTSFDKMNGVYDGPLAHTAQQEIDHLHGIYCLPD